MMASGWDEQVSGGGGLGVVVGRCRGAVVQWLWCGGYGAVVQYSGCGALAMVQCPVGAVVGYSGWGAVAVVQCRGGDAVG